MKKKTGVIVIALSIIITVLMCYTAIAGWGAGGTGAMRNIHTGLDLSGGVSITYEANEAAPSASDMNDTIYKLQKRVEEYSTEANVYQEGANRISVEIPGVTDADAILAELGTPGSLYFIAQTDESGNTSYSYDSTVGEYVLNYTIEELTENGAIVCTGSDVASAEGAVSTQEATGNKYVVQLTFNESATAAFAAATEKAVKNNETIGIYYDGHFVSVPTVNSIISNGQAVIEGMESIEKAKELASYIRIGGLKLLLNEIRSNVVGAQLGQNAIRTSLIGGAIGLAIVCVIMIIAYLVPGIIASFVLVLYAALILVLLNAFDLTLTLPGIAGIILSIGMAVDANVIIYARIREEIAAAVLGMLGTGTIKGFAMTLALGVVLSLFTACVVSRFIVFAVYAVGVRDPKFWSHKLVAHSFDFVGKKKISQIVAGAVIALGLVVMVVNAASGKRALNFSMEFLGGTSTTVGFEKDYTLEELDNEVKPVVMDVTGDANVSMQQVVGSTEVVIKTRTLTVDERQKLTDSLSENFGIDSASITTENISATVGAEMRNDAILAVVVAVVLMLLYIFIRFKDMRFATSAVIALIHDVLVTLAAYAVLRISVGNSFIAVMLTILGYSINSTIVIFDRIRENLQTANKGTNLAELVNASINRTLTRSIYTNLTTLASILVLYIVGVTSIKEFTLPMMVGIVAGTFSSVFLTGPLWYLMRTRLGKDAGDYAHEVEAAKAPAASGNAAAAEGVRSSKNPNVIRKKKKK